MPSRTVSTEPHTSHSPASNMMHPAAGTSRRLTARWASSGHTYPTQSAHSPIILRCTTASVHATASAGFADHPAVSEDPGDAPARHPDGSTRPGMLTTHRIRRIHQIRTTSRRNQHRSAGMVGNGMVENGILENGIVGTNRRIPWHQQEPANAADSARLPRFSSRGRSIRSTRRLSRSPCGFGSIIGSVDGGFNGTSRLGSIGGCSCLLGREISGIAGFR